MPPRRRHRTAKKAKSTASTSLPAPVPAATPATPGASPGPAGRPGVHHLHAPDEGAALGAHLLAERDRPVVVITIPSGASEPYVNPADVADEVGDLAGIYVLPTGVVTWALSETLPDERAGVYGGAARVYPVDREWIRDPYRSELHFSTDRAQGRDVAQRLVSDVLREAYAGQSWATAHVGAREVAGVVVGVVAGRGVVRLDSGENATVRPELLVADLDGERLLRPGQHVRGMLDPGTGRLDLRGSLRTPADALAGTAIGAVVLARVRMVERDLCVVEVFPDFQIDVPAERIVGTMRIDLRRMMSEGDVLPFRVLALGAAEEDWLLSALEADDAPALPAPAVLPEGPAWLLPPVSEEDELDEDVPLEPAPRPAGGSGASAPAGQASASPGPSAPSPPASHLSAASPAAPTSPRTAPAFTPAETEHLAAERDSALKEAALLRERVQELERDNRALAHQRKEARTARLKALQQVEQARGRARAGTEALAQLERDRELFDDPAEQLRWEVELAWLRRFPPGERRERRRAPWELGDQFLSTWAEVEGIDRQKVVDVIVEVIVGLAADLPSRELHQLRTGTGGNDRPRTRDDGATAWRVSLQVKTPSARRLHYWQRADGVIELASIRLHDDYRT